MFYSENQQGVEKTQFTIKLNSPMNIEHETKQLCSVCVNSFFSLNKWLNKLLELKRSFLLLQISAFCLIFLDPPPPLLLGYIITSVSVFRKEGVGSKHQKTNHPLHFKTPKFSKISFNGKNT